MKNINFIRQIKIIFYIFIFIPFLSYAAIDSPVRNIRKLEKPEPESMLKVQTAKVMIADYDLIRKDFAYTKKMSEREIDQWLLNSFGFISVYQTLGSNKVNSEIKTESGQSMVGYRPQMYGRALVMKDSLGQGLVDAKGLGSINPQQKSHQNGLLTVGEGLREFLYEKLVEKILIHHRVHFPYEKEYHTVGTYAVLDWGFDVIHNDSKKSPAGAVLRQAHDRYGDPTSDDYNFLPPQEASTIEKILRRYGVTSAGVGGRENHFEIADLQGSKSCEIVDFGSFLVKPKFIAELLFFLDSLQEYELKPTDPSFPQIDQKISIPLKSWSHAGGPEIHPRNDIPRKYSDQAAIAFRRGEITQDLLKSQIEHLFFKPVLDKWYGKKWSDKDSLIEF